MSRANKSDKKSRTTHVVQDMHNVPNETIKEDSQ